MPVRGRVTIHQTQRLALNPSLHNAIHVLAADAEGLVRLLEDHAAENPALRLSPPPERVPGEWLPRWHAAFAGHDSADTGAPEPGLLAHVMGEAARFLHTPQDRRIALALAEALEPSGWLGPPLSAIAAESGASLAQVEEVLARLQKIDPPGLFARNLAECLALQAVDAGRMDAVLKVMLAHLDLVARGDFARLARLAECDPAGIAQRVQLIRSFDPKPGARFDAMSASHLREPDLIVTRTDAGWQVALNRSSLPSMLVEGQGEAAASARAMLGLIERRNDTLLTVAREILRRQARALDQGRVHLVPMAMASVAEATGLHESTVSRVVAGTAADTPLGTIWLRALFSGTVAGQSAAALRERLLRLVADEDPARPLSDQALAERLMPQGGLARRTVAKYRADLSIPPASRRRALRFRDRKGRPQG